MKEIHLLGEDEVHLDRANGNDAAQFKDWFKDWNDAIQNAEKLFYNCFLNVRKETWTLAHHSI